MTYLARGTRVEAVTLSSGYSHMGVTEGAQGTVRADVRSQHFGRIVDVVWDAGPTLLILASEGDLLRVLD